MCDYDLRGLPRNHRCPECGFEYDENTRMWQPTRAPGFWFLELGSVAFPLLIVIGRGVPRRLWDWCIIIVCMGFAVWAARRVWTRAVGNAPKHLVIGEKGFAFRSESSRCFFPWSELPDDRHEKSALELCRELLTSSRRGGVFDTSDEEREFREQFREARARWISTARQPAPPGQSS